MKYIAANKVKIGDFIQFQHEIFLPCAPHEFPKSKMEWKSIKVDLIEKDEDHDDALNFIEYSTGYIIQRNKNDNIRLVSK